MFFVAFHGYHIFLHNKGGQCVGKVPWALILSLSVCYHARLQERNDYEAEIVKQFQSPLDELEDQSKKPLTPGQFKAEIRWYTNFFLYFMLSIVFVSFHFRCQEVLLENMKIGHNIARNAALRENVFMMAICIQLKIPLFLVGKPGSSKSLAKSIIADSLAQHKSNFLKDFNEVCDIKLLYELKVVKNYYCIHWIPCES